VEEKKKKNPLGKNKTHAETGENRGQPKEKTEKNPLLRRVWKKKRQGGRTQSAITGSGVGGNSEAPTRERGASANFIKKRIYEEPGTLDRNGQQMVGECKSPVSPLKRGEDKRNFQHLKAMKYQQEPQKQTKGEKKVEGRGGETMNERGGPTKKNNGGHLKGRQKVMHEKVKKREGKGN